MERKLNYEPTNVFEYFEDLTRIPRGSGEEKAVSDYLVEFAKKHGLEYIQDDAMNVIIKKPASKGYEHLDSVILQGHMDMVNEKNGDKVHDFSNDPLTLKISGDYIYADNTTLGADNGIAVAMTMAILSSDNIPHPAIEAVFTVEEETGLVGAYKLDASVLKGKYLINLDSEEEGELLVSCAGGARVKMSLPVDFTTISGDYISYKISIRGLKGGHSGMDIIKGRGNSNKIMGRLLSDLQQTLLFEIFSINGGSKMNAIPRECDAFIAVHQKDMKSLESFIDKWRSDLRNELKEKDEEVMAEAYVVSSPSDKVLDTESKQRALAALMIIPSGINSMSAAIDNLVESSVNLGIITTNDDCIMMESAVRSSVRSLKKNIIDQYRAAAYLTGSELIIDSDYPEWQYNADSKLRTLFEKVYKDMNKKESKIVAIHAGVECGLFKEKMPDLDMISLGPNMAEVHTPNEHLSISSVKRTYEYLLEVLRRFSEIDSLS